MTGLEHRTLGNKVQNFCEFEKKARLIVSIGMERRYPFAVEM